MSWDAVPWFVGGGAEHSPEVARLMAYAATSGAEGVVHSTDLRVRPLDVPGGGVRVMPGAALIRNRATGGAAQTYVGRLPQADTVEIAPTGSGAGRSDLIVARVEDPYMPGEPWQEPEDPTRGPYVFTRVIPNVSPTATTAPAGQSAIPLARIDLPASTGTVTAAMITDLREVALPRSYRRLFTYNLTSDDGTQYISSDGSEQFWPNVPDQVWYVDIPEWATHANIIGHWGGVKMQKSTAWGTIWVRIGRPDGYGEGNVRTQDQRWDALASGNENDQVRETWAAADDITIPAALRGTSQPIRLMARRMAGGASPGLDSASSISVDVQFTEGPA